MKISIEEQVAIYELTGKELECDSCKFGVLGCVCQHPTRKSIPLSERLVIIDFQVYCRTWEPKDAEA